MWRYLAGGAAALSMTAAGWLLFNGQARTEPLLPSAPVQAVADADEAEPATLPAASERSREQKRYDRYDKDRDAKITRAEYLEPRRKAFAKLDVNGDGRLSFEEWSVKTTARFDTADKDRSGTLTAAEFATTKPKRSARPTCRCAAPAASGSASGEDN
jgi:hypothetical protein